MRSKLEKRGDGAIVRIPATLMSAAGLSRVRMVNVRSESDRIIIERLSGSQYDLAHLVKRITPKNRHPEIDFGRATIIRKKR